VIIPIVYLVVRCLLGCLVMLTLWDARSLPGL
jgi:hypothetical protein